MTDLGRRFVACFVQAADDAGLPNDPAFRAALRSYMEWAVSDVLVYSPSDRAVFTGHVENRIHSRQERGAALPRYALDTYRPLLFDTRA